MTRYLYDALYPAGIPLTIEQDAIVASYIDHPEVVPPCMEQLAQRFPTHSQVGISAHGHTAKIYDVESGAIGPTQIPDLLIAARAVGYIPAVYASPNNWTSVNAALRRAGVAPPLWWAVVRASSPFIPAGAVGNQWLGAGPYDKSIITDEWAAILDPPIIGGDMIEVWWSTDPATNKQEAFAVSGFGRVGLDQATLTQLRLTPGRAEVNPVSWSVLSAIPIASDPPLVGGIKLSGTFDLTTPPAS